MILEDPPVVRENKNPIYPRMYEPSRLILRVWEDDFGAASVDPESLVLLTLIKIYKMNATINRCSFPYFHDIPSLEYGEVKINNGVEAAKFLIKLSKEEERLNPEELIRIRFYKKYFNDYFVDTFFYYCWVHKSNYNHAIATWYKNVVPFPFGYIYLRKKRKAALKKFSLRVRSNNADRYMNQLLESASRCLNEFASLLDNNERYLLSNTFTSLDALVYSYLAIALAMPLKQPFLQKAIKCNKNLIRYVGYINFKFYPDVPATFKYVERAHESNERISTKTLLLAITFVSSAMLMYAFTYLKK